MFELLSGSPQVVSLISQLQNRMNGACVLYVGKTSDEKKFCITPAAQIIRVDDGDDGGGDVERSVCFLK